VILKHRQVQDLERLSAAVREFGVALRRLAAVSPRTDRMPVDHPELQRLAREFAQAAELVEKAVGAKGLTVDQYARVARHFEVIAEAMERGAVKEAAAEKRAAVRAAAGTRTAVRKPPRRRR
jgi:hypothetical protein